MTKKIKRLQELSGSGYEVAKGQPDIRGWEVRDTQGNLIGKIHELIFDSRASKVRYMIINVNDSKELQLEKRTVMLPIGLAVLEHQNDDVILSQVTPFQLRALPRYQKDDLGTRAEHAIGTVFGRGDSKTPVIPMGEDEEVDETFYNNEMFNEDNMYSRRNAGDTKSNTTGQETHRMSQAEAASLKKDAENYFYNKSDSDALSRSDQDELRGKKQDDDLR